MEKNDIATRIHEVLIAVVGHDRFEMRDDLTAPDVEGWDSLTHMSIITGIESAFNVRFKLREINKLRNMGTLIELVQSKLSA